MKSVNRTNTVVTEFNWGLVLSEEDREYYTKWSDYIIQVISMYEVDDIFLATLDGDIKSKMELITACCNGVEKVVNGIRVSRQPSYYCYSLAEQLGWNKDNDTTIEFYKDIEESYHPNKIKEISEKFYEIVRLRSKFLAMHPDKIDAIIKIVSYFKGKRIIIFNDGTEMANKVATVLESIGVTAHPYHSSLESVPMMDQDGNLVKFKSGKRAGQVKMAGVGSRKKFACEGFNNGKIQVISFAKSLYSDVDLHDIDIVIFTSGSISKVRNMIFKAKPQGFTINKEATYIFNLHFEATIDSDRFKNRQLNNANRCIFVDDFDTFKTIFESRPQSE